MTIGVSTVIILGMMYLNIYALDHISSSHTRVFMALMMGVVVAVIMSLFIWRMYENRKINATILAASLLVLAGPLFMVRSQTTVSDTAWMKAMIPHYSTAILASKRADLKDPEVRKLTEEIIQAQEEEIDKMKEMIKGME